MLERHGRARPVTTVHQILAVGRLVYQKDHATLLRAMARLTDLAWHLRIIGDGPLRNALQALADELGIAARVSFEGFLVDPGEAYASSDVLVLSSRWEGFPAVPLEAMASGCQVVTTSCSDGLSEIMRKLGCPLVPIGDDAALARVVRETLGGRSSPNEARAIAAEYSIASSTDEHMRLIGVLLSQGHNL